MKLENLSKTSSRTAFVEVLIPSTMVRDSDIIDSKHGLGWGPVKKAKKLTPGRVEFQQQEIDSAVKGYLIQIQFANNGTPITSFPEGSLLKGCVAKIVVSKPGADIGALISLDEDFFSSCAVRIYRLWRNGPLAEEIGGNGEETPEDNVVACHSWDLPNAEFEPFWDSLVFESDIKEQILSYAFSMMRFSEHGVDPCLVTANRLVLLHGPPGTGKTTLCKAVAQKLAIRMGQKYPKGVLVEINSHSLFSRWFSESGKLVMKMFEKIHVLLSDPSLLVFVLIDEVESLTVARKASMEGHEPSDAVRVVNALLTQIDFIRRWPNVMVLTTSNLAEAVDDAFMDRADLKQYIPPPSQYAIYSIYLSCIKELQRASIIDATDGLQEDPRVLVCPRVMESNAQGHLPPGSEISQELLRISQKSIGLSGRTLRKLPVLADAFCQHQELVGMKDFLVGLSKVVDEQLSSKSIIAGHSDFKAKSKPSPDKVVQNGTVG